MTRDVDFAHTTKAEVNRDRKAHRLARAAFDRGMVPWLLTRVVGPVHKANRSVVLKAARVRTASEETWALVVLGLGMLLEGRAHGGRCDRCGEPVLLVRSERGKDLVLDVPPHELGHVIAVPTKDGIRGRVLAGSDDRPDDVPRFRPHQVTCVKGPHHGRRLMENAPPCPVCREPMHPFLVELGETDPRFRVHPCCDPDADQEPAA